MNCLNCGKYIKGRRRKYCCPQCCKDFWRVKRVKDRPRKSKYSCPTCRKRLERGETIQRGKLNYEVQRCHNCGYSILVLV